MSGSRRPPRSDALPPHERTAFERRWWFFAGIWLVYLVSPLSDLWNRHHSVAQRVVGVALVGVFAFGYVVMVPQGAFAGPQRRQLATLATMVGAAALYMVFCGDGIAFAPYLVVAFILMLRWPAAVSLSLATAAAATFAPQYVHSWGLHGVQWGIGAGSVFAGVLVGGMRLFAGTAMRLHRAEAEIEQLGADQERLRIARDLHDLLGHALTTVTMKAELASRLVTRDPQRAAAEMAEVAELARQSLADVRATVSGYREMSLVQELAAAREILQAADIEAELPGATEDVPGDLRELFGWAVREGVTNAVRHSRARRVAVRVGDRVIEIENDGVMHGGAGSTDAAGHASGRTGQGLMGLRERAALVGGSVEAGRHGSEGFLLRVEVPA
jgi:two-component system sensor histidine kinase DesK